MAQDQIQPNGGVPAVSTGGDAPGGGGVDEQFVTSSLYVSNLDVNVGDSQLYDMFNKVAQVVTVLIIRDLTTRRSLGYGYVHFSNPEDAAKAMDVLNFNPLNNKPIRIMYSHHDPIICRNRAGKIFIKPNGGVPAVSTGGGGAPGCGAARLFVSPYLYVENLERNFSDSQLYDMFNQVGQVVSVRVCQDMTTGRSLGCGYVNYASPQDAARAIDVLNFNPLNNKPIKIMYSLGDPCSGAGNIY